MALNREAIFVALNARLAAVAGFAGPCSRQWVSYADTPPEMQPALFLATGDEQAGGDRRQPTVWTLRPKLVLYTRHDADPTAAPSTLQNQLITALEAAMEMTPGEAAQLGPFANDGQAPHTTLGGLVSSCRIFGTIVKDEGLFQTQGIAEIPLEIVTTA
jgi:hypothetical protein